jgi:hypothetical protein
VLNELGTPAAELRADRRKLNERAAGAVAASKTGAALAIGAEPTALAAMTVKTTDRTLSRRHAIEKGALLFKLRTSR